LINKKKLKKKKELEALQLLETIEKNNRISLIKACAKGFLERREYIVLKKIMPRIQAYVRRFLERKRYKKIRRMIVLIQAIARMSAARTRMHRLVKRVNQRKNIIQEILSTERTYVDGLNIIVVQFVTPLKNSNIIDQTAITEVFANIEDIQKLQLNFLVFLEKRMQNWKPYLPVGDIFLQFAEQFKLYTQYINNFDNA